MLSYFALIGLGEDASRDEIEERCRELSDYLGSTAFPPHIGEWASAYASLVDEALAELLDEEKRARATAAVSAPEDEPTEVAPAPMARAAARGGRPQQGGLAQFWQSYRRPLMIAAAVGAVVLGVFIYGRGGGNGSNVPAGSQAQQSDVIPVDAKRMADLMAQYQKDPQNVDVLFEIGESFFLANRFQEALDWEQKLLAIDPKNVHVRTDLGTSYFNLGKADEAKAAWLAGLDASPDDVQLHYNMGFLYANAEPRDVVAARKEWQRVVDLAPDSELAKVVKTHMDALLSPSQTP